jgi:pyrroline-5-carboxylate reductase
MIMKLAILGFGNMGSGILTGLLNKQALLKEDIRVYSPHIEDKHLPDGIKSDTIKACCLFADVVICAFKPQQFALVLPEIKEYLFDKVLVSIAAAVETQTIESYLDQSTRVLRIMPNLAIQINQGILLLSKQNHLRSHEKIQLEELFSTLGRVEWVNESDMDTLTVLSASAPAFYAYFINALVQAMISQGLTYKDASNLCYLMMENTLSYLKETHTNSSDFVTKVCSKGGMTIEGILVFESYDLNSIVDEAVALSKLKCEKIRKTYE